MKPTDYNFRVKDSIMGLQFLFVAFGALVLVPILTGLDPNVALFTAGIGTLVFQFVNRNCVRRKNKPRHKEIKFIIKNFKGFKIRLKSCNYFVIFFF